MSQRNNLAPLDEAIEDGIGDLTPLDDGDDFAGQPQDDPEKQSPAKEDAEPATDDGEPLDDEGADQDADGEGADDGQAEENDDSPKGDKPDPKLITSYQKAVNKLAEYMEPEEYEDFMNGLRVERGAKPRQKQPAPAPAGQPAGKPKTIGEMTPEEADEVLGSMYQRRLMTQQAITEFKTEKRTSLAAVGEFIEEHKIPDEVQLEVAKFVDLYGPSVMGRNGLPVKGAMGRRAFVALDRLNRWVEKNAQSSGTESQKENQLEAQRRATDKGRQMAKASQPKGGHLGTGKPLTYQREAYQGMTRSKPTPLSKLVGKK